jgi:predicted TIM-barrel fold metal-dependent hydrolase
MVRFFAFLLLATTVSCAHSVKKAALSGTDCHVHVHSNSGDDMSYDIPRAMLAVESVGLQRACVLSHSFNHNNNPACWVKGRQCTRDAKWVRKTNEWTLQEAKKFPQAIPFCGIEIGVKIDTTDELKYCKSNGAKGIKMHLEGLGQKLSDPAIKSAFIKNAKVAGELGLVILVHAGSQNREEALSILKITKEMPKTKFILAHMLRENYDLLGQFPLANVYTDISATIVQKRKESKKVVDALRTFGIDRVLFASDWPVIHPAETMAILESYPFNKEEFEMIRSKNAERLFGKLDALPPVWRTEIP